MVQEMLSPKSAEPDQAKSKKEPEPPPAATQPAAAQPPAAKAEPITGAPVEKIKVDPVVEELEVLRAGSDPEILEIYLEEAEEEAHNIGRLQEDWLLHPEDENALKNIRRAFHTIKGSGRLVGAIKIGEFAWEYEQLLNRVIDKTMRPSKTIVDAVGMAANTLPKLIRELKAGPENTVDIGYLRGLARTLSQFNAEQVLIEHTQTLTIVESPYDHITDDDEAEPEAAAAAENKQPEPLLDEIEPDTLAVDSSILDGADLGEYIETPPPAAPGETPVEPDETVSADSSEEQLEETVKLDSAPKSVTTSGQTAEAGKGDDDFEETLKIPDQYTRAADYKPNPDSWDAEHVDLGDDQLDHNLVSISTELVETIHAPEPPSDEETASADADLVEEPEEDLPMELVDLGDDEPVTNSVTSPNPTVEVTALGFGDDLSASSTSATEPEAAIEGTPVEADPYSAMEDPLVEIEAVSADEPLSMPDLEYDAASTSGNAELSDPYVDMEDPLVEVEAVSEDFSVSDPGSDDEMIEATSLTGTDPYADMEDPQVEIEAVENDDQQPGETIDLASGLQVPDSEARNSEKSIEFEVLDDDFDTDVSDEALSDDELEFAMQEQADLDRTITEIKVEDVEEETIEAPDESASEELKDHLATLDDIEVEEVEEVEASAETNPGEVASLDDIEVEEVEEVDAPAIEAEPASSETTEAPHDPLAGTTSGNLPGKEAGASVSTTQEPSAAIGLSFDPELLTIYQQEVEQHLSIISSALDRAEQIQELVPDENIYRALHTIHGASRTADIASIGELASLMEQPLKSSLAHNVALDHEIIALYRQGQRALQSMTEELVAHRRVPRIPEDLEISLRTLAEDFDEPTVEIRGDDPHPTGSIIDTLTMMSGTRDAEQDNELLAIFVDEANELLEMSDHTLHDWSQQGEDDSSGNDFSAVMELQRYLHTLKGGARMAELDEISDLAHEMESMFIAVIDGRVEKNNELLDLLKNCFDQLHRQVSEAEAGQPMTNASERVEQLRELRRDSTDDSVEPVIDDDSDLDSEDIDIVSENLPDQPLAGADRSAQDVIKVRSDLLDNLVNSAGEVNIYRARMEQQVAGLGSHLSELGQTILRLKGQLRNLEAETDAQIHYSHRSEAKTPGEFDPLEMDRYTMIQELSRSLSESVNDLSSLQHMLGEQVKDSETLLLQQSRVSTDLQDGLIKSRMVRFSGLLSRLRRLVRQSSQELGKKAELLITGEENEVDNKVLDRMVAPLEHIIRNAVSHGIETPVERVKRGKSEMGRVAIDISRDGSDIVIRVSDDGAGVNIEKVRSRAIQLGLLDKNTDMSESDLVQLILEPGFSTAEHVTQLSGRGVGMDVVDIEVKQLGGTLQIETNPSGTTFIARLPFTLSINQAIMVRSGDETYAIPLINIEGITRLSSQRMAEYYRNDNPQIDYAGQKFPLHHLTKLVGANSSFRSSADDEKQAVILSRAGDIRVALHVDEIIGNREIVVKSLGKQLSQVTSLSGASILADGSVVLILDIAGLMRASAGSQVRVVYQGEDARKTKNRNTVMVVDDSITMRRVASKLLERHNYDVVTAKDGVDALAQLEDVQPDVMLLDIEMPRMDGFELATHMRNEENYSKIPIIMITSRTGEKHRHRAFEIGVTKYMGKPYQEEELIENIQSALTATG